MQGSPVSPKSEGLHVAGNPVIYLFFNFIGAYLIYNVVLVSGVQQSDSVIHIHIFILFQILFPLRLLQNNELHSLCYTVGACWSSLYSQ